MNDLATQKNDEARPDVDVLLHGYFQAELPHVWPSFKAPMPTRTKRPASMLSGRLALAACLALLVGGYLALSGFAPGPQTPTGVGQIKNGIIGGKERKSKVQPDNRAEEPMPTPLPVGSSSKK